jgi:zinc protease
MSHETSSPDAPGLAPLRVRLANGAVVVAKETPKTPAVSINLAVRAGSIDDAADAPGATHLLSRVIDRGTASRSADTIADELDGRGISLTITVTRHLFTLACTCLAEDFDAVLALLADIVTAPSVPETELTIRKREAITVLRQDQDNPAITAVERLMELLYGPLHPYGRRARGTIESVEALTRNRLLELHAARFAPSEVSVVVVGGVEVSRVMEAAESVFGPWKRPAPPAVAVPPAPRAMERRQVVVPMMNKAQTDVAYGFTTLTRSDPEYYAAWLMNNVLGQYALGGRLGDSIRERQGMAYYVSSTFDPNVGAGPLMIRAGVSASNVERAIASIDEEMAALVRSGITTRELAESRQYMIGSMPRALETNAGIAQFLQTAEFFGLGLDYDLRLSGLLGGVTLDQVHAVARRYLDPARATVVVAGPYQGH